jgi:hypothetical protein
MWEAQRRRGHRVKGRQEDCAVYLLRLFCLLTVLLSEMPIDADAMCPCWTQI